MIDLSEVVNLWCHALGGLKETHEIKIFPLNITSLPAIPPQNAYLPSVNDAAADRGGGGDSFLGS